MSPYNHDTTGEQVAEDLKANIANKTILITGLTPGGLGASFAAIVAKHQPACLILATRQLAKAEEAAKDILAAAGSSSVRIRCVELDLSSMQQVRKAASEIKAFGEKIDIIVNNAGIMAAPFAKTVDGLERQFGTNHIGHFLLTNLLLPDMVARGEPLRVINVSSNGFRYHHVRFGDHTFDDGKTYNRWFAYGQSKSANMLFSRELAKRLGGRKLRSFSVHPGVIHTNLARSLEMKDFAELGELDRIQGHSQYWNQDFRVKTLSQGVATHIFAAFSPELDSPDANGSHLVDGNIAGVREVNSWARDPVDAERLWELSEEITGQKFVI